MKYRVTGSNRETGARMSLEFEAESKAQAERKAEQAGMTVNHAEPITEESAEYADAGDATQRRRRVTRMHPILRLLIIFAIVVIAYLFIWPMIRARM